MRRVIFSGGFATAIVAGPSARISPGKRDRDEKGDDHR
jgi:hypothetical protein